MANGEVGKVGVAIDSLEDMEILLDDIPLDKVSTSMTINATAAMLLLLYQLVAEQQGCPPEKITGTVQNDILKEYAARGTYIFPPRPSMRLVTDLFAYCRDQPAQLEHDLDLRLPHARGGVDRGRGDRVHAEPRHRVRRGRAGGRPGGRRFRPAALVLLRLPHGLLRGGREVSRRAPDVGAHHARPVQRRATRVPRRCASTPRRAASR